MRRFWWLICKVAGYHFDIDERPYCLHCGAANLKFNPFDYYNSK